MGKSLKKSGGRRYSPYARALPGAIRAGRDLFNTFRRRLPFRTPDRSRTLLQRRPIPVNDVGEARSGPWAGKKVFRGGRDKRTKLQKLIQREINRNSATDSSWSNVAIDNITTAANGIGWVITNSSLLWDFLDLASISAQIASNSTTSTAPPTSFYVKDGVCKHTFANASTGACKVIAYHCIARRDIPVTRGNVAGTWTVAAGTKSSNVHNLMNVFLNSLAQASGGTALSNWQGPSWSSTTPYQAPMYCEYVNIYKTEVFELEAGGIASTYIRSNKGRVVHSDFLQSSEVLVNEGTRWIMYKVQGQPANDSTTHTNVGIAPVKLVFTNEVRYHYTFSVNNKNTVTFPSNPYGTITTAEIVDAATGATANIATA